jgi:hypothetical protein
MTMMISLDDDKFITPVREEFVISSMDLFVYDLVKIKDEIVVLLLNI